MAAPQKKQTEEELLNIVIELLRRIPPELQAAALQLTKGMEKRLVRYFLRNNFSEADAEEMTTDTVMKFLLCNAESIRQPLATLWVMAENIIHDRLDMVNAQKRGGDKTNGHREVLLDDESYQNAANERPHATDMIEGIHLKRVFEQFETSHPVDFLILQLKATGHENDEIATTLDIPLSAVRDRIFRAKKRFAQVYEAI